VQRLGAGDTFNIIRFSSDATSLFDAPQLADGRAREAASQYIDQLHADGGTEMRLALDMAFAMPASSEALRQIVFITDGSVSNEAELVKSIHERIDGARLFTVGIGAAPNAYFMREAASAGHGSYTFIPNVNEVRERMEDVFRKLENPALVDLQAFWPGGAKGELAASLPSDVYAGDPLVIAARLPKVPEGVLTLTGRSAGGAWTRQLQIKVVGEQSGIAKLWARERIGELSRQKNFGADPKEQETRIVELAVAHHLVSEFTSLVAVDETPVRPVDATLNAEQVPTSAPVGSAWAASTTGFSSTATPAPLLWILGLLALAVAVVLWTTGRGLSRPEIEGFLLKTREPSISGRLDVDA
jgi:Ca-activated chloride channel family protein